MGWAGRSGLLTSPSLLHPAGPLEGWELVGAEVMDSPLSICHEQVPCGRGASWCGECGKSALQGTPRAEPRTLESPACFSFPRVASPAHLATQRMLCTSPGPAPSPGESQHHAPRFCQVRLIQAPWRNRGGVRRCRLQGVLRIKQDWPGARRTCQAKRRAQAGGVLKTENPGWAGHGCARAKC